MLVVAAVPVMLRRMKQALAGGDWTEGVQPPSASGRQTNETEQALARQVPVMVGHTGEINGGVERFAVSARVWGAQYGIGRVAVETARWVDSTARTALALAGLSVRWR